jgi:hypothetical protein
MTKCKNCGVEAPQTEGKRAKLFCSDNCRVNWHQKNKKTEKSFEKELSRLLDSNKELLEETKKAVYDLLVYGIAVVNKPVLGGSTSKSIEDTEKPKEGSHKPEIALKNDSVQVTNLTNEKNTNYSVNTIKKLSPLDEIRNSCPKELIGIDRTEWISKRRSELGV